MTYTHACAVVFVFIWHEFGYKRLMHFHGNDKNGSNKLSKQNDKIILYTRMTLNYLLKPVLWFVV